MKIALLIASVSFVPIERATAQLPLGRITQSNWDIFYEVTPTDGVRIYSGTFNGRPIIYDVSVPNIRVDYGSFVLDDQLGPSGNIPFIALSNSPLDDGFALVATYQMALWPTNCTYKYVQEWRFHSDGRWEPWTQVWGPGCLPSATYNVYLRMDLDLDGASSDSFEVYRGGTWTSPCCEGDFPDDGSRDPNSYAEWRHLDIPSLILKVNMEPYPPDNARFPVLQYHYGEGTADHSAVIADPTTWANGESVQNADVVDWYWIRNFYIRPSGCPPLCNSPGAYPGPWLRVAGAL